MTKLIDPIDCAATRGAAKQAAESHKSMIPTAEAKGIELLARQLPEIPNDDGDFTPDRARKIIRRYQELIVKYWDELAALRLASTSSSRLPVVAWRAVNLETGGVKLDTDRYSLETELRVRFHQAPQMWAIEPLGVIAAPPSPSQGAEREAFQLLLAAALLMPRATPKPGGASTVHTYEIEAAYVWALDNACRAATRILSLPLPEPSDTKRGEPDWRDDPSADERWNAGLDYGMKQFCAVLGVDPNEVRWDAATETLDGDVSAAIWNILRTKMGDEWDPDATPLPVTPDTKVREALEAAKDFFDREFGETDDLRHKHIVSTLCDKIDAALSDRGER